MQVLPFFFSVLAIASRLTEASPFPAEPSQAPPPSAPVGATVCSKYNFEGHCTVYDNQPPGTCIALAEDEQDNFVSARSIAPRGYCDAYSKVKYMGKLVFECSEPILEEIDKGGYGRLSSWWGNGKPFDYFYVQDFWENPLLGLFKTPYPHPHIRGFKCYDHPPA